MDILSPKHNGHCKWDGDVRPAGTISAPRTALEALASMQSFLRGRPKTFESMDKAIEWANCHLLLQSCLREKGEVWAGKQSSQTQWNVHVQLRLLMKKDQDYMQIRSATVLREQQRLPRRKDQDYRQIRSATVLREQHRLLIKEDQDYRQIRSATVLREQQRLLIRKDQDYRQIRSATVLRKQHRLLMKED
ncbi:hypothetical protein Btru_076373 [Bulinus truncatus]|nr:hypothetical protein Btru_076373 [Bulinus truncatus]